MVNNGFSNDPPAMLVGVVANAQSGYTMDKQESANAPKQMTNAYHEDDGIKPPPEISKELLEDFIAYGVGMIVTEDSIERVQPQIFTFDDL